MSSFPDVLSAELFHQPNGLNNKSTFTVPAEYAFAVVQVCLIGDSVVIIGTSHGNFSFNPVIGGSYNNEVLKDLPILNLIIKGGESFSLTGNGSVTGANPYITSKAKITALCHKKPS